MPGTCAVHLQAFAEDDRGARLAILLLADPCLLEGGWWGQNRATNPVCELEQRGAMIVIFVMLCALAVISFCILSPTSGYRAVPPDVTVLAHRSLGMPASYFMMVVKVVSQMPWGSMGRRSRRTARYQIYSLLMVIACPSGIFWLFSKEKEDVTMAISCSKSKAT